MSQLDIYGMAVPETHRRGPAQGVLIEAPTAAQARAGNRLQRALLHFASGINLLWSVDLQQFSLPPLSATQLQDARDECRRLRRQLEDIEAHIENAITEEA